MERLSPARSVQRASEASEWNRLTSTALLLGSGLATLALPLQPSVNNRVILYVFLTLLVSLLISAIALIPTSRTAPLKRLIDACLGSYWSARLLVITITLLWGFGLLCAFTGLHATEPALIATFAPLALVWPPLLAVVLLRRPAARQVRPFASRIASVLMALSLCWLLLEGLLQAAFARLPAQLTAAMPQSIVRVQHIQFDPITGVRQYPAGESVNLTINRQYGDLYYLSCLKPPESDTFTPYSVTFTRDAHGFRNPTSWPTPANLVMVGDSFVEADGVQHPFWEGISPSTLTLGSSGTGSLEQSALVRQYALPQQPRVVVMTYFEGNDLGENWEFQTAREHGQTIYDRIISYRHPWNFCVTLSFFAGLRDKLAQRATPCSYPLTDSRGNSLAFYDYYLAMATVEPQALQASAVYEVTRRAIVDTAQAVQDSGATFVLAFIPSKVHVHWPYLVENGQSSRTTDQSYALTVGSSGLIFDPTASAAERAARIDQNSEGQVDLLRALAAEKGFLFVDFTPALQATAGTGVSPYFTSDTHWNQTGHDVARKVLSDFLSQTHLLP